MSVDVKAASENVKQALGIGTIEDTLAGDQLRRAVAAEGRRVLLDARMLRRALEQEGAVERNIQLFCLMSGAPGLSELLEERSGATQADLDRFIRNAVEYTGLSRGTVLLKTYQICRAADLPMAYNPKDSRSVFMKGAAVAYAFPPELYESALAPFRAMFDREKFNFISTNRLDFESLGPLAQAGVPEAQFYLGFWMLEQSEESQTAVELLKSAAHAGSELAGAALGDYYFDKGFGDDADDDVFAGKAAKLLGNSYWDRAFHYYTGYGSAELNDRRRSAVASIVNHGAYNRKLKLLSGILLALMAVVLFAVPGLMIGAAHPIWGIGCLVLEAAVYVLMLRVLKVSPYMHAEVYPMLMSSIWIVFLILRILF